jgi:hypothetical protein
VAYERDRGGLLPWLAAFPGPVSGGESAVPLAQDRNRTFGVNGQRTLPLRTGYTAPSGEELAAGNKCRNAPLATGAFAPDTRTLADLASEGKTPTRRHRSAGLAVSPVEAAAGEQAHPAVALAGD